MPPVFESLIFYLAAFAGNVAVYLGATLVGAQDIPLDAGLSWKGRRIIGDSRTFGGALIWIGTGLVVDASGAAALPPSSGIQMALGALFGTVINSFLKRRFDRERWPLWLPLDELDFVLGASLFQLSSGKFPPSIFITGLVLGYVLHRAVNMLRPAWERLTYRYSRAGDESLMASRPVS